jgi:L-cysteine desulfidase
MKKGETMYSFYIKILEEELKPAMGCTEPIAIAYAAAKARTILGKLPDKVIVEASGSIIKNVKSVIVPNTEHLKGIPAAAAAGIIGGNPQKELEVIAEITNEDRIKMKQYLEETPIEVKYLDEGNIFDIIVTVYAKKESVSVRISGFHTNIVQIEKNGEIFYSQTGCQEVEDSLDSKKQMNMEGIWDFVQSVEIEDVREVLDRQIQYNMAISEEGLERDYGANIGSTLLKVYGNDIKKRAAAKAAAGSDARMNGCELPVVINSGSGNQGITCSVPVIEYARELKCSEEKLYRALVLSNLVAIYQKVGIGCLSAYCGAVSAGAAAGAGIAFLLDGGYKEIVHTVVNALAITSGMICDGAKASCAAKIASSVDAGILGYYMYLNGQQFYAGDGIVTKGIDATIQNIGRLGRDGMKETNEEIIKMMIQE